MQNLLAGEKLEFHLKICEIFVRILKSLGAVELNLSCLNVHWKCASTTNEVSISINVSSKIDHRTWSLFNLSPRESLHLTKIECMFSACKIVSVCNSKRNSIRCKILFPIQHWCSFINIHWQKFRLIRLVLSNMSQKWLPLNLMRFNRPSFCTNWLREKGR